MSWLRLLARHLTHGWSYDNGCLWCLRARVRDERRRGAARVTAERHREAALRGCHAQRAAFAAARRQEAEWATRYERSRVS